MAAMALFRFIHVTMMEVFALIMHEYFVAARRVTFVIFLSVLVTAHSIKRKLSWLPPLRKHWMHLSWPCRIPCTRPT
jgi:hypothetical protein